MTDPSRLTETEIGAWHGMLAVHAAVIRELDRRLRADQGLAVSEFDVLITLVNAEDQRLRMTQLAASVMLSPAGMTHLVTRLERDGLVQRQVDAADRRSFFVGLTAAGRRRLDAARSTHDEVIRRRFTAKLSTDQLGGLAETWPAVLGKIP